MIVFAVLLVWSASGAYQPVKAEVRDTSIESTRPGTLQWSLMVGFHYEVDGILYQKRKVDVFHDSDRRVTENKQKEWPVGKQFTIYYRQSDPNWFSLTPDSQANGVLATLLIGMAVAIMAPVFFAWRRGTNERGLHPPKFINFIFILYLLNSIHYILCITSALKWTLPLECDFQVLSTVASFVFFAS